MQAVDPGLVLYSGDPSATSTKGECDALLRGHTLVSVGAQSGDTVSRNGDISSPLSSPRSMSHLLRWLCYSCALGPHLTYSENMLHTDSHHPQKHFCRETGSLLDELPNITHKPTTREGESPVIPSLGCHFTPLLSKSSTTHLAPALCSRLFGCPI